MSADYLIDNSIVSNVFREELVSVLERELSNQGIFSERQIGNVCGKVRVFHANEHFSFDEALMSEIIQCLERTASVVNTAALPSGAKCKF